MTQQATIRTAFASPKDAARIYGVSATHVKDLLQSLDRFKVAYRNHDKAEYQKTNGEDKAGTKMKSAKSTRGAAKQKSASRSARKKTTTKRGSVARKARRVA